MTNDPMKNKDTSRGSMTRRRLVRAAGLAGPAVITLRSGQAWAASNCTVGSQPTNTPNPTGTNGYSGSQIQSGGGSPYGLYGAGSSYQSASGEPSEPIVYLSGRDSVRYSC